MQLEPLRGSSAPTSYSSGASEQVIQSLCELLSAGRPIPEMLDAAERFASFDKESKSGSDGGPARAQTNGVAGPSPRPLSQDATLQLIEPVEANLAISANPLPIAGSQRTAITGGWAPRAAWIIPANWGRSVLAHSSDVPGIDLERREGIVRCRPASEQCDPDSRRGKRSGGKPHPASDYAGAVQTGALGRTDCGWLTCRAAHRSWNNRAGGSDFTASDRSAKVRPTPPYPGPTALGAHATTHRWIILGSPVPSEWVCAARITEPEIAFPGGHSQPGTHQLLKVVRRLCRQPQPRRIDSVGSCLHSGG